MVTGLRENRGWWMTRFCASKKKLVRQLGSELQTTALCMPESLRIFHRPVYRLFIKYVL